MISVTSHGDLKKTNKFLNKMKSGDVFRDLDRYGRQGVDLLSSATPRDTGRAASSWRYQVGHTKGVYSISWVNTDREGGVNVALILQYGHGTGTGGYVVGRDYINPALRPHFDKIVNEIWRQVTNA
jgi:hypothetical protein